MRAVAVVIGMPLAKLERFGELPWCADVIPACESSLQFGVAELVNASHLSENSPPQSAAF